MGQSGQRADVGDLGGRVGRAFDEQEAGLRPDGGLPGGQVIDLHIGGADVVTLEQPQHAHRGAEHRLRTDDVIPCPGQAHDHRMDGCHAGCGRHAGFCPFQRSQPVLEDPHGGIAKARIDEAIDLARKLGRRMGRIVVHEAGAEIDGLGVLAIGAGVVAARTASVSGCTPARRTCQGARPDAATVASLAEGVVPETPGTVWPADVSPETAGAARPAEDVPPEATGAVWPAEDAPPEAAGAAWPVADVAWEAAAAAGLPEAEESADMMKA